MRILIASEDHPKDVDFGSEKILLSVINSKRFRGEEIIERRRKIDVEGNHFVTLGNPVDEIAKFSNALNVDFVVVNDVNLGLNVASKISKPVLVLKFRDPFKRGLICYDSIFFNFKIKTMLNLLPFEDMHILHVLNPILSQNSGIERIVEYVNSILNEIKIQNLNGVHVRVGNPMSEILKAAEDLNVTCIVMSVGKTTEEVAKKSKTSILIWRDLIKRNGFIQRV